jgi:alcohol dehydrogenase class IV
MQIEIIGRGRSSEIPSYLTQLKVRKILLVTGKASYAACGAKALFKKLLADFDVEIFDAFTPNPTYDEALSGTQVCQESRCEAIIGVGGGSAIDVAKTIAAFQAAPGQEMDIASGKCPVNEKVLPLIAVPTTAGTGSESTHFSVIYIDGKKYSLASPSLLPSLAVIDAQYTDKLPPYITACTAFDALCQAVESYWACGANDESRDFARQAIRLLLDNMAEVVNAPSATGRDALMKAANLAGKAINISKTTAPHALSYTITSLYGLPHGHAVALSLGSFFPFHENAMEQHLNGHYTPDVISQLSHRLYSLFGASNAEAAKRQWYVLMKNCGLSHNTEELGIPGQAGLRKIVAGVNPERLGNHPLKFTTEQLEKILESIPSGVL